MREAPDPPFFEAPLLKPYVFFDVSRGREQRGGASGGSLRNQASPHQTWSDAQLCCALWSYP